MLRVMTVGASQGRGLTTATASLRPRCRRRDVDRDEWNDLRREKENAECRQKEMTDTRVGEETRSDQRSDHRS